MASRKKKRPRPSVRRAARYTRSHRGVGYPKYGKETAKRAPAFLDEALGAEDSAYVVRQALMHRKRKGSKQVFRRLKRGKKIKV